MESSQTILTLLYDRRGGFFSLAELASAAGGMHQAELAAALDELAGAGQKLEYAPAHGVRLIGPVRPAGHLIERDLGARRIGRNVICFDEVGSTNDVAFDAAMQDRADGLVVLAEAQRCGRGRHGRTWLSPPGANILMSVVLLERDRRMRQEALMIAAGLAAAEGIEQSTGVACGLKWPNDVVIEGAKVWGVLVESRSRRGRPVVVIGVGVNVHAAPVMPPGEPPAAALADHAASTLERIEIIRALLRSLDEWAAAAANGELDRLHDAWVARCGMLNQRIAITSGGRTYVGRVLDISPRDGLVLGCDGGGRVHIPAENATVMASRPC